MKLNYIARIWELSLQAVINFEDIKLTKTLNYTDGTVTGQFIGQQRNSPMIMLKFYVKKKRMSRDEAEYTDEDEDNE